MLDLVKKSTNQMLQIISSHFYFYRMCWIWPTPYYTKNYRRAYNSNFPLKGFHVCREARWTWRLRKYHGVWWIWYWRHKTSDHIHLGSRDCSLIEKQVIKGVKYIKLRSCSTYEIGLSAKPRLDVVLIWCWIMIWLEVVYLELAPSDAIYWLPWLVWKWNL